MEGLINFKLFYMKESITYVMDLVDEYTAPAQKIITKAGQMDGEFKDLNDQLKKSGTIKADLDHFGALNNKLDLNSEALKEARLESKRLGAEIANTTKPTKKQISAFEKSKTTVNKLRRTQTGYRSDLKNLSSQLLKTGVNTNKFAVEQRKVNAVINTTTRSLDKQLVSMTKQARQMAKLQGNADKWSTRASKARGSVGAGDVVAAGGAIYAVKKLADAYGEVATAQGELKSLDMTIADIDAVTNKAREFSSEYAGFSQSELIKSTYDLKSGISSLGSEALAGFLEISALVAGGTKANIDTVTALMATGYGVYRTSFDDFGSGVIEGWDKLSAEEKDLKFGEYFGAGIATAVQQFKTDGDQMSGAIERLGQSATTSNVPLAEQLAILGSLQTTMSGSEAATKYKAFLRTAVKMGGELGLTVTDSNNQLLSTPKILEELRGKYGEVLDDVEKGQLQKLMGDEGLAYVTAMYDQTQALNDGITSISEGMANGKDSYTKMADAIMKGGPAESMQLLGQINKNLMADMGAGFAPIIAEMARVVGGLSVKIGTFLRDNKELASYLAIGTTTLIALKIAVITSQFAFGGLASVMSVGSAALLFWRNATIGATISTGLMSKVMMVFNAVLAANPIGVIVVAIIAAGIAIYALYKNWDFVVAKLIEGALWLDDVFGGVFSRIFNNIMAPFRALMSAYELVKGLFSDEEDKEINSSLDVNKNVNENKSTTFNQRQATPVLNTKDRVGIAGAKSQVITSNDTYQFNVPESNDPLVVKAAIKDALAERDREKELKTGGLMYD